MLLSLNEGASQAALAEIDERVRGIVDLPDPRRIDGRENVFFAMDDDYLVIFERQGDGVLIRSIAEAAGYPGLAAHRSR
jgi:hypothetical protein